MDVGYSLPWWFIYAFLGSISCYFMLFVYVVYIRPWAYKRWSPLELGVQGVVPGQPGAKTDEDLERAEKKSLKEAKRLTRLLREQEKALKQLTKRQGGINRERERLLKKEKRAHDPTRTNRHHGKGGKIEARGERERQRRKRERKREAAGEFRHEKINTSRMRAPQSGV